MNTFLVRIQSSYFVAGLIFKTNRTDPGKSLCIQAAPILHYMRRWKLEAVQSYCKIKNWSFLKLDHSLSIEP